VELLKQCSFAWEGQPNWGMGHLKVCNATTVPPLSGAYLKAIICIKSGTLPGKGNLCITNIASSKHPMVIGVLPNSLGEVMINIKHSSPVDLELQRNDISNITNVQDC
jgi:hypothetical protein